LALFAALLLALVWLTQSASGRAVLLDTLLAEVNAALPGKLFARELGRLDFWGLALRGLRVLDPSGQEVLRLDELDVELAPGELLRGRIVIPSVRLANGAVDLREIAEARRGLIAAFVDPSAPPSPPSSAPPPYVAVGRASVRGLDVRAPPAGPLGQLDVRGIVLDASYELDTTSAATLSRFEASVLRDQKPLARFETLEAELRRKTAASRAKLVLGLPHATRLTLAGSLVVPPEPSFRQRPVDLTLKLENLAGGTLAELLENPALEQAYAGAISAELVLSGTLEQLESRLSLETPGGPVAITGRVDGFERVSATLTSERLELAKLRSELPAQSLKLALSANADAKDPARIPVRVELRESRVDQTPLPALTLGASITPRSAEELELLLVDGKSKLRVKGSASFAGALKLRVDADIEQSTIDKWARFGGVKQRASGDVHAALDVGVDERRNLDVNGEIRLRNLVAGDVLVKRADVSVRMSGEPSRPVGTLKVRVEEARAGAQKLSKLALSASGGPVRYEAALDADFGDASALVHLDLERGTDRVTLSAQGKGHVRNEPWSLSVEPTTVTTAGELDTRGVSVDLSGQNLSARGAISKRRSSLELETGSIDLERLGRLLRLPEPLHGSLKLVAHLSGTPAVPDLNVRLEGRGLALGERPPLDLELRSAFSATEGEATAELALAAVPTNGKQKPLDVRARLSHHFRKGPGYQRAVLDGTLDFDLELERLESGFVAAWAKLGPLPAEGVLKGRLRAAGTRSDPKANAELRADARVLGVELKPVTRFEYAAGSARLELAVDDPQGRWVDLAATLELPGDPPSLGELAERAPRLGSDAAWSVVLIAGERNLSDLPGLTQAKIPASAGASLVLEHAAGEEPRGRFRVSAAPGRALDTLGESRCRASGVRLELEGELASGRIRSQLSARERQRELFGSSLEAELALARALSGGKPELGRIHGELWAKRLELASLPVVCGMFAGTLDATARFDDPLGARPDLVAELTARDFSLGTNETLSLTLRARANHELAQAELELLAKGGRSTLEARLPLTRDGGASGIDPARPFELDVVLNRLPIAPFLNPKGAISYASGAIDGRVRARGKLDAPDIRGELTLRDVAFTATDLSQPLRRVRGTFAFTQNRLNIRGFEAHDRDGVLKMDGVLSLEPHKRAKLLLSVSAKEFPIRQQGEVVATTDLEAKVKAELSPERTEVVIDLGAVDMWIESLDTRSGIALEAHPDFSLDGRAPPPKAGAAPEAEPEPVAPSAGVKKTGPGPKAAPAAARGERAKSAPQERVTLLELNANERIWIKRDDFAVKLAANLTTEISGEGARVKGRVQLLRGYLTLMGKNFEIQKSSTLAFIGSQKPDPVLDITAAHLNRRSGEIVSVVISGRGSKPVLTFRIDDKQANAGEAFQAIYGSQQSNEDPEGADSQAKAFVGGLTAGLLATTARRELGAAAPIIMIEPGAEAGSGRVRAGFEFDSLVPNFMRSVVTGVYFEGIVSNDASGDTQGSSRTEAGALLEFYFPRNFFTSGQYGPGPTWSMDVGWQL
jgi:autotransporter translocation and assembly factor TamB